MIEVFEKAFRLKENRNWECIAVAVDLHGTVFVPTYSESLAKEFYPHAKECLQLLTKKKDVLMYMYTCSHFRDRVSTSSYLRLHDIAMYIEAHEVMDKMEVKNNEFQDFVDKPYFNVLLDDKAGFDPDRDWVALLKYLKERQ